MYFPPGLMSTDGGDTSFVALLVFTDWPRACPVRVGVTIKARRRGPGPDGVHNLPVGEGKAIVFFLIAFELQGVTLRVTAIEEVLT